MPNDKPWERKNSSPKETEGNLTAIFNGPFEANRYLPTEDQDAPGSRLDYALKYTQKLGWSVIPCHWIEDGQCSCNKKDCPSPGKHPLTRHGIKDATRDEQQIRDWFEQWPQANIAVATGKTSGILVIDVDPRNGGNDTLDDLIENNGPLPDTAQALTGGGGQHFILEYTDIAQQALRAQVAHRAAQGTGGKTGTGAGIDVQGDGKYIIVEPSDHISGTAYTWEGSSDPLEGVKPARLPQHWLCEPVVLKSHPQALQVPQGQPGTQTANDPGLSLDPQTLQDLRSALNFVPADERDTWIAMGARLKDLGAAGREIWISWSQTSDKWRPQDAKQWDGLKAERTGYQAIFKDAQARGWINPLSLPRQPQQPQALPPRANPDRPLLVRGDQFAATIRPVEWIIKGYIESNCMMQLFGAPGSGKSFLAIDWALSIATHRQWQGHKTSPGAVIYIAGEGQNGLARRVQAWTQHHSADLTDAPIYFSTQPVQLLRPEAAQDLSNEIAKIVQALRTPEGGSVPVRMIIIDTLARNFGDGDENSTRDMGQFIHNLTIHLQIPFETTVLVVHHSGHKNKERGRGASTLPAAVDINYLMDRDTNDILQLSNSKMKDADEPEALHFGMTQVDLGTVDDEGDPVTSCVLEQINHQGKPPKIGDKQRAMMGLFDHLTRTSGTPEIPLLEFRKQVISGQIYGSNAKTRAKTSILALVDHDYLDLEDDKLMKGSRFQSFIEHS